MNAAARTRLRDALVACQAIHTFVEGITFAAYADSLLVRSAVERQFEIIGEALRQAELADSQVAINVSQLRQIVGMRNRRIHGYDAVDQYIVWIAVHENLPRLVEEITNALAIDES